MGFRLGGLPAASGSVLIPAGETAVIPLPHTEIEIFFEQGEPKIQSIAKEDGKMRLRMVGFDSPTGVGGKLLGLYYTMSGNLRTSYDLYLVCSAVGVGEEADHVIHYTLTQRTPDLDDDLKQKNEDPAVLSPPPPPATDLGIGHDFI